MSFSISAINAVEPSLDSLHTSTVHDHKPLPTPTAAQDIDSLASAGQAPSVIAQALGIPVSQVDSALEITSTSSSQATALIALSGRLNVQA